MTARARVKGVVQRRGRWHYVRRVPKDMAGLVLDPKGRPREYVQIALRTDSRAEA